MKKKLLCLILSILMLLTCMLTACSTNTETEEEDAEAILENVKVALEELRSFMDIGEGTITASETEDKDWINNWKEYFHSSKSLKTLIKQCCRFREAAKCTYRATGAIYIFAAHNNTDKVH